MAKSSFVPLRDLLTKNLDDRVQDYLTKMDGMTLDEIVNGIALPNTPPRRAREDVGATAKQQLIVEHTRSQANVLSKNNNRNGKSNLKDLKLFTVKTRSDEFQAF